MSIFGASIVIEKMDIARPGRDFGGRRGGHPLVVGILLKRGTPSKGEIGDPDKRHLGLRQGTALGSESVVKRERPFQRQPSEDGRLPFAERVTWVSGHREKYT